MKILNFGSLNVDYVYQVDHILIGGETLASSERNTFCGGKGLNQSVSLARAGAPVWHAGLTGDGGEILLEMLKDYRVHTEFVRKIDGPCGHTVIQVDKNGQNGILLYGGSNRRLTKEFVDEVIEGFEAGDYILLQNEINQLDYIIDRAYENGMKVVLNPSPFDSALESCDLGKVSLFLINEIEGFQITGEKDPERILGKIHELYPQAETVLTLGGESAVWSDGSETVRQEAFKVKAVDTTAAGDTFTGYFLTARMEGLSVGEALRLASRASSIAVTRPGAAGSVPLRNEVQ